MERLSAEAVVELLQLEPLPAEGGFFRRTWQSAYRQQMDLAGPYRGATRSFGTAIYYLITQRDFSAMHQVSSDELWHFYAGDPLEQLLLFDDGKGEIVKLGNQLEQGYVPQRVVPAGVWQGTALAPSGEWALVGCTVCPGFEYADYTHGNEDSLVQAYPRYAKMITRLCR